MSKGYQSLPSWQLTFPTQCMFQDDFLFPRWDILVSWRVHTYYKMFNFLTPFAVCSPPHCKFDCRIGLACHSLDSGLPKVGQTWVRSFIISIRFLVLVQNLGSGFGTKILGTHISKVEDSNVSFWHKGHENYQPVHGIKVIYSIYCDTSRPFSPFFLGFSIISLHFIPGVLRKPIQGAWKHASDPKTKGQILEVSLRPREKLGNLMRKLGDFGPLHPGKLTWNTIMEVCFRWFSFSRRWFSGSMLIFWGFNRNQTESTEDAGLVTIIGGSVMGSSPKPTHLPRLHPRVFFLSFYLRGSLPKV